MGLELQPFHRFEERSVQLTLEGQVEAVDTMGEDAQAHMPSTPVVTQAVPGCSSRAVEGPVIRGSARRPCRQDGQAGDPEAPRVPPRPLGGDSMKPITNESLFGVETAHSYSDAVRLRERRGPHH